MEKYLLIFQDDTDVNAKILNVSFSVKRPDVPREEYYSPQFLQEKVYLNRAILAKLSTVQVRKYCLIHVCITFKVSKCRKFNSNLTFEISSA